MSRCDGSWGNYPPSRCVCNCRLKQGFPSGSTPAQVSEQLMTFGSNRMKEMAVVCSQQWTTFVLLSAVCLNLPATLFTPQGDHVIRSPPLAHLSSCSTTPPEKDCSNRRKKTILSRQGAVTSNVHHLLAHRVTYRHYSFKNHTRLIFLFPLCHPTWFWEDDKLQPLYSVYLNVLFCFTMYPVRCIMLHIHSIFPYLHFYHHLLK